MDIALIRHLWEEWLFVFVEVKWEIIQAKEKGFLNLFVENFMKSKMQVDERSKFSRVPQFFFKFYGAVNCVKYLSKSFFFIFKHLFQSILKTEKEKALKPE